MKTACVVSLCLIMNFLFLSCLPATTNQSETSSLEAEQMVALPEPEYKSTTSVEEAISNRVSIRQFSEQPLHAQELSQILWAAQGKGVDGTTGATRTAPSAGATHPIEIYIVSGGLMEGIDLPAGIYYHDTAMHGLVPVSRGDQRDALFQVALRQGFVKQAPVNIVLTAEYERTLKRYGERGRRYVHMEIGHVTQNIHLQAESLGLGSVAVGAFEDEKLKDLLKTEYEPLMIIPVGNK